MKLNAWIRMTVIFVSILALMVSCGNEKKLVVGVNDGYKPFGYEENGEKKGFEVELWEAIAEEAGIQYEMQSMPAGEILKNVRNRKLDAAVAGITIKESRKKKIDFSTPYLHTGQLLAVDIHTRDIQKPEDLKDKIVAVKIGTSGYEYASKIKGIKEIMAFPEIEEAFEALEKGEADAVVYDAPGIRHYVRGKGKGKVKTAGTLLTKEHYAVALPKGSVHTGRINNALKALADNGKFEEIYVKWFGHKPESLPRSS